MKRKSIMISLLLILIFFLISCSNSKDVYVETNEFFENKVLMLKEGEVYQINYDDLVTNKFSYEIEEYKYILGRRSEEAGSDILFEDKEKEFRLYGDSNCLELKENIITAKGLGRVTVNVLIKMKRYTSNSWRELLCCPILEVVVTDDTYSNFTRINNENDFEKLNDSSGFFLLNHSLDLEGANIRRDFSGILINPYNYVCTLTIKEYQYPLFTELSYACVDNLLINEVNIVRENEGASPCLLARQVNNSIISNILMKNIKINAKADWIVCFYLCKASTFKNIEIETSNQIETYYFYMLNSIDSEVIIKNSILKINSQNIKQCGVTMFVQCTVTSQVYSTPYDRKSEDAFEVYNTLFINTTSNKNIKCLFHRENNDKYPFGKDKLFYSVGFDVADDLFINKTMEEITSGENLFTAGEFKFEKEKLPTLFY